MSKSCATCRFSSEERPQAGMLVPILMCRYGPLMPVMVPMVGPNNPLFSSQSQMVIRALCPSVAPTDWCHRHEALPSPTN